MSDEQKPILEEDAKIARILGAVLLVVLPIFGFYVGSVWGKDWFYDYRMEDLGAGGRGVVYGLVLAIFMNIYMWVRYKNVIDKDLVEEWYDPQAHHSGGHH